MDQIDIRCEFGWVYGNLDNKYLECVYNNKRTETIVRENRGE